MFKGLQPYILDNIRQNDIFQKAYLDVAKGCRFGQALWNNLPKELAAWDMNNPNHYTFYNTRDDNYAFDYFTKLFCTDLNPNKLDKDDADEIFDIFPEADLSLIKRLEGSHWWTGYEEAGGVLVFIGIDDKLYCARWSNSVYDGGETQHFAPLEVTQEELEVIIKEIEDTQEECL